MHRRPRLLAATGLLLALSFGVPSVARAQELSGDAQRVVAYLLDDWAKQFRSTSIPLAMDNLDMEPGDALRLEIGQHFREHTELATNLRYWGANNYILTNEEKRIAKFLIQAHEKQGRTPQLSEAAQALEISPEHLRRRLAFMAQAGLLQRDPGQELGFSLIADYEPWGGPLRHNFHTARVEGEKPFDVWWAVDFLLLVNSNDYKDKRITIEDSCSHCALPINVEVDHVKIAHVDPDSVWVQQGGGWAVDNLFWSEEHVEEWLTDHPEYRELNQLPIREFLEQLTSR